MKPRAKKHVVATTRRSAIYIHRCNAQHDRHVGTFQVETERSGLSSIYISI